MTGTWKHWSASLKLAYLATTSDTSARLRENAIILASGFELRARGRGVCGVGFGVEVKFF